MAIVRHSSNDMPPISPEELDKLDAMSDQDIDFSDSPEITDFTGWMTVEQAENFRQELYRNRKQAVSIRIDKDILHWLKSEGRGYQTKINQILRKEMEHNRAEQIKKAMTDTVHATKEK